MSRIAVQLTRHPPRFDAPASSGFKPLSLPDRLHLPIPQLAASLLQEAHVDFAVDLAPGAYALPLTHGVPCQLEVPAGCRASGRLRIESRPALRPGGDGSVGSAVVAAVDVRFSRPLVFRNIVSTLDEVRTTFRDHLTSAAGARLAAWLGDIRRWVLSAVFQGGDPTAEVPSTPAQWLASGLRRAGERVDGLVEIRLDGFRARPRRQWGGARELALRFDGQVALGGQVPVPFRRVRLPRFILPRPQAQIEALLGDSPLASAELLAAQIPWRSLLNVLTRALAGLEVSVRAELRFPQLDLDLETFNRSRLRLQLGPPPGKQPTATLLTTARGRVSGGRLRLQAPELSLVLDDRRLVLDLEAEAALDELVELAVAAAPTRGDRWTLEVPVLAPRADAREHALRAVVRLHPEARIGPLRAWVRQDHPLARGSADLGVTLNEVDLVGGGVILLDATGWRLATEQLDLGVEASFALAAPSALDTGQGRVSPRQLAGRIGLRVSDEGEPMLALRVDAEADFEVEAAQRMDPIPELSMLTGELLASAAGHLTLGGVCAVGPFEGETRFDFQDSRLTVELAQSELTMDGLRLALPADAEVSARVNRGHLGTSGLGELELGVSWDMRGKSPVLSNGEREAVLLVDELRRMAVTARISPSGRLSFAGGHEGLYDGDYLNALVEPMAHADKWREILASDEAMQHVLDAAGVLSPELQELAAQGREAYLRATSVFEREGIEQPADVIPRDRMARTFSLVLAGDDRLQERLAAIIKRVTEADGVDRRAVEAVINELFPDHRYAFELDRALRWLDLVLSPGEPLPPPARSEHRPLAEDPRFAPMLTGIPAAADLYAAVDSAQRFDPALARAVVQLAPWMTLEQVDYLSTRGGDRWSAGQRARLSYVLALKKRIDMIARGYGGIGHAPQPAAIAFFLGDVLAADERYVPQGKVGLPLGQGPLPCHGILGPEDVAVLLRAGLTNVTASTTVQINQRTLFDYIRRRPPLYFVGVLAEMGMSSPRVLTNVLLNFLNQDQQQMKEPCDMPATLSGMLGIDIPRREDYMAGGRWAKDSYYLALMRTAEFILSEAAPYLACKSHLQTHRHPASRLTRPGARLGNMEASAQKAIAHADELGGRCGFEGGSADGPLDAARAAYEEAFAACRAVLEKDRTAFQRDWLKQFWRRNHEALVIRSVLRNHQEDVDDVRRWLAIRTGASGGEEAPEYDSEQALLKAVVAALYHFDEDRQVLLADPLVRLLIDPPDGRYDFTIVSAMGVITEGVQGRELEAAFERVHAQRGVRVIRADTGTARTLEYNADRIIEAIEQAETPYGLVGYSQGCANILMAEVVLRGGTPRRQALLEGLRARNLLFSAANGSAHGSCGNEKFLRAMVEGELFLKHYQAIYSSSVTRMVQNALNATLDSPAMTTVMGSVDSLSHEGVIGLFRDGQYIDRVPTSTVRGAVFEAILPEALEFLANVITRQVKGALHDTQVTLVSAVGHSYRVTNAHADVLERCDIGSFAQSSHHWSPLLHATEFITTERDRERAIYDFPKDRHIFPWVEVNARFGNIDVRGG